MTVASKRDDLAALVRDTRAVASPFRNYLNELYTKFLPLRDGEVANYIPELARANPDAFGISVVTTGGQVFSAGNHQDLFTIQSVSKPFVFALAMGKHGRAYVNSKVGVEPTGDAFNSLIRLEENSNRPHNPMVNAGAIATADLIEGPDSPTRLREIMTMFHRFAGRELSIDMAVFVSERSTGHRNRAIAHLMLNFGMIGPKVDETLDLYFQQCSVQVSCQDLAVMAGTLANHGVNPIRGERAMDPQYIRDLLSVMLTCGIYDNSGEWAYHVGIPAKSGVGGGMLGVIPGRMGIAVYSPPLDSRGNSVRGRAVFEQMSKDLALHIFESGEPARPELRP
jgi:glutaminase